MRAFLGFLGSTTPVSEAGPKRALALPQYSPAVKREARPTGAKLRGPHSPLEEVNAGMLCVIECLPKRYWGFRVVVAI
jgi:hypothetical protein